MSRAHRHPRASASPSSNHPKASDVSVPPRVHLAPHDDPHAPGVHAAALHASLAASHPFDLAAPAGPGLLDAILEVVGADTLTLRATLALWQREQDRLTNRAWRRPGGLARPGGV